MTDLRPVTLPGRMRGKALKYASVSLISTAISQVVLYALVAGAGWHGAPANVAAVTVSSIPSFFLNRAWVWGKRSGSSLHREVIPFWLLSLAGLVLSTLFAAVAYSVWKSAWSVMLANILGFGVLWVAKFVVLDEYLFRHDEEAAAIQI